MAVQKQDDQHKHTFSSYVTIRDVVLKTCLGRWTKGRSGERGSGISMLPARHDGDDDTTVNLLHFSQVDLFIYLGEISHLRKVMSIYAEEIQALLLTGNRSNGNLISDKIKCEFYQALTISLIFYTLGVWGNDLRKSLMSTVQGCSVLFWYNPGSSTQQYNSCTAAYLPYHKPSEEDELNMIDKARETKTNSWETFFPQSPNR